MQENLLVEGSSPKVEDTEMTNGNIDQQQHLEKESHTFYLKLIPMEVI